VSKHATADCDALLADGLSREQLIQVAQKLFDAVSAPAKIGMLTVTVRPSIGIAAFPADGASADALLDSADAAMYSAKRHRSGHAFFDRRAAR
jgi:GGDEF domain-containing protein